MSIIITYNYNYFLLNYIFNIYTNIPYYSVFYKETIQILDILHHN